ncbi:FRIHB protein, partial [Grallaria varia]|nr:FRIHB protein [Grallaria varia]
MESQIRQNYHRDCEAAVNRMANMELHASYVYLSMGFYFERDDVALPRLARFFREQAREEREHAEGLLRFQTRRGGRVLLQDVKVSGLRAGRGAVSSVSGGRHLPQTLVGSPPSPWLCLISLFPQLCDFLESHYLEEQVKAIKALGDHVTNLRRLTGGTGGTPPGLGEYLFDRLSLEE